MKVLVVDNEPNIKEGISLMVNNCCPSVSELHEANSVKTGIKKIAEVDPNIVLLDVELDDGTGMDILSALDEINFQLVFITAHNKYAINAFKFSAIDFLLKPISSDDLVNAFEKAEKQIKNRYLSQQLVIMQETLDKITSKEKKIALKDNESIFFVNVLDIIRCQAAAQYTEFYLVDKKIVISKPLKEYEELLEPYGFIRPHHSHLINKNKIVRFDKVDGGSIVLENAHEVPVSQRKKAQILQILEEF